MITIAPAAVYIVALLVGIFVRRVRYPAFVFAVAADADALALNLISSDWLAAGMWVFNLGLVALNWRVWRRTDARTDALRARSYR